VDAPAASVACRPARPDDAAGIARIYNQGIADRSATFETRSRTAEEVAGWLAPALRSGGEGGKTVVVAEDSGTVVGWGALSPTSARECYTGVLELSIYVDSAARGRGVGRALGEAILAAAAEAGAWKVVGKLFPENRASASLVRALGFREVGLHRRHARLDGAWRDVLVVEKLVGEAATS
jgi:phosphinothricin acetyltransferase